MALVPKRLVNLHLHPGKPNSVQMFAFSPLDLEISQYGLIPEMSCGSIFVILDDRLSVLRRPPRSWWRYLLGILAIRMVKAVCKHLGF